MDALDYVNAHTWPYRKIAEYVQKKFKVQDWWAQTVTVGYERIRGLRELLHSARDLVYDTSANP